MTDTAETSTLSEETVNFYEEFTLSRDDSLGDIREALRSKKIGFAGKRQRAGQEGERARRALKLIALAETVFADEDSKDAYDLRLRRTQTDAAPEDADIDWIGRAWGYYFIRDYGAAAVAARKAREHEPDSAIPYVVSAWVNLAEGELRRAKSDVDEAFVLDELGDDTVDVQHVRGAVLFEQCDYDRALTSFERAYAKAGVHDRADLLRRKAWVLEYQRNGAEAFATALEGLTLVAELPEDEVPGPVSVGLTDAVIRACDYIAGTVKYPSVEGGEKAPDARKVIRAYEGLDAKVKASRIPPKSLQAIKKHIDTRIEVEKLRDKGNELERVPDATGEAAGFPLKSLAGAVFALLLGSVWPGFYLVALGLLGWAVYCFMKRSEWKKTRGTYQRARSDLESTLSRWKTRNAAIEVPAPPIPLALTGRYLR